MLKTYTTNYVAQSVEIFYNFEKKTNELTPLIRNAKWTPIPIRSIYNFFAPEYKTRCRIQHSGTIIKREPWLRKENLYTSLAIIFNDVSESSNDLILHSKEIIQYNYLSITLKLLSFSYSHKH